MEDQHNKRELAITTNTEIMKQPRKTPKYSDTTCASTNSVSSAETTAVNKEANDDTSNIDRHSPIDFNSNIVFSKDDEDKYFDSFPPGYRFKPYDDELVVHYLKKKILDEKLPANRIKEVELYKYNPETLAANYKSYGEREWYFFTPRDRKYRNGERPNRAAGDGYWKATGADKNVLNQGVKVGYRKALVFYKGKPPKGDKTDWIMHEYRLDNAPPKKGGDDMRLDDWVLCRIYRKVDKSSKATNRQRENAVQPQSSIQIQSENNLGSKQIIMPCPGSQIGPMTPYSHFSNVSLFPNFHSGFARLPGPENLTLDQASVLHTMLGHGRHEQHEQQVEDYHLDEVLSYQRLCNTDFENIDQIDQLFDTEENNGLAPSPYGSDSL